MWCETTPLTASPNRHRRDNRRMLKHVSAIRVGIESLSGHIGFTNRPW